MQHSQKLRKIAPRQVPSEADIEQNTAQLSSSGTKGTDDPKESRLRACQVCRRRKSKCNGERPQCSYCFRKGLECEYDPAQSETSTQAIKRKYAELQKSASISETIIGYLREKSDLEALHLLEQVRSGQDLRVLIEGAGKQDLWSQTRLVPESRFRYTFPYKYEMPKHLSQGVENAYLSSLVYEFLDPSRPAAEAGGTLVDDDDENHNDSGIWQEEQYLKPYDTAELIEPLIETAQISYWTRVSDNETMLKKLMKGYFLYQYPFCSFFHKDIFLRAMASRNNNLCSSLLVNAILADACHSYPYFMHRNEPWNTQSLSYRFLGEAKRLWELNMQKITLPTIQGGLIISMIMNMDGLDRIGWNYLTQVTTMSCSLNIFDLQFGADSDQQIAHAVTGWSVYSWQAMTTFHFGLAPLLVNPPTTTLPDPRNAPAGWYSELYFRYPSSKHVWAANYGHVFHSTCHFRSIVNEIARLMYGNQHPMTYDQVLEEEARLELWLQGLPPCLAAGIIVLPFHLKVHIHYYDVVRTLLAYGKGSHSVSEPRINAILTIQQSLSRKISAASIYMETLLRLYYLRHGYGTYDEMLVHFLSVLSSIGLLLLRDASSSDAIQESARSTIVLALAGIAKQAIASHLAHAVFILTRNNVGEGYELLLHELSISVNNIAGYALFSDHVKSMLPVTVLTSENKMVSGTVESLFRHGTEHAHSFT